MNKAQFLAALRDRLSIFPDNEIDGYIEYYEEIINDHVEDGYPEEKVIQTLGGIDGVMAVILEDVAITHLLKSKMKPKRKLKKWELMLWIFGFPVWLPLAITAFAMVLTLYIVLWTLIICLWAVEIVFPAGFLYSLFATAIKLSQSDFLAAGIFFGGGLLCAGLSLLFFRLSVLSTKGMGKLSKKIWLGIKFLIIGKEKQL